MKPSTAVVLAGVALVVLAGIVGIVYGVLEAPEATRPDPQPVGAGQVQGVQYADAGAMDSVALCDAATWGLGSGDLAVALREGPGRSAEQLRPIGEAMIAEGANPAPECVLSLALAWNKISPDLAASGPDADLSNLKPYLALLARHRVVVQAQEPEGMALVARGMRQCRILSAVEDGGARAALRDEVSEVCETLSPAPPARPVPGNAELDQAELERMLKTVDDGAKKQKTN